MNIILKDESYQEYLDHIDNLIKNKLLNTEWIEKIMNNSNGSEYILYDDDSFILIYQTDKLIDEKNPHILAFIKNKHIKSIRDLSFDDIDKLEYMYKKSIDVIKEKIKINRDKMKIYFHYRPSVWLLHIHFSLITNNIIKSSVEYTHDYDTVINFLKFDSDFYRKINMKYVKKLIFNHLEVSN